MNNMPQLDNFAHSARASMTDINSPNMSAKPRLIVNSPWIRRLIASDKALWFGAAATLFLFYYSIILIFPRVLLEDPDTLWHIRTGEWILSHARVPTVDFYSYTAVGQRWISTEWLSEVLYALAYRIGEWRGVVILSAISCAAIVAIICFHLMANLRFSLAIAWTALTALVISHLFLARPHIFSYIILIIFFIKLLAAYDRGDFRSSVPILCTLMIFWANLHPSFTFGLALLYVVAGYSFCEKFVRRDYKRCRDELFAVIAVSVCGLITPYGIFSALLTLDTMKMRFTLQNVMEWHAPDFQQARIELFFIVACLMTITGLGIRLRGPRLIVYGMLLILCLSYMRGLAMFYLLMPIILAQPIAKSAVWCRPARHRRVQSFQTYMAKTVSSLDPVLVYLQKRVIVIVAICFAGAAIQTAFFWHRIDVGPPGSAAPKAAIDYVTKAGIIGNVFNNYNFGGYLIFKGIPTFIDGRVPPYTDEFLKEYFDALTLADIKGAFNLLDRYKVTWVLLLPTDPLAKALTESRQWTHVYLDKYSTVLVRSP
jgi:hypothetical protein